MRIILSDLDIVARTLYGEARGESFKGKKAVAHVLINRTKTTTGQFRKDDTLATSCLRHVQFSTWNANDANFDKMYSIDVGMPIYRECIRAILEALDEPDFTEGARHYYSISIPEPIWARGHKTCFEEGKHRFYNDVR